MISTLLRLPFQIAYFKYKRFVCSDVRPWFINFIVTFRCNSYCNMCGIWRKYISEPEKVKEELSLPEIRDFLSRNKGFLRELRHIGLTGGEPFLREDIVEIVRSIKEILPHIRTGIQTNGQVDSIRAKLNEIVKFYPELTLAVSVDGIRETHDKIRGARGSFDKAIGLIKYARRLGISVTSGMTLSKFNYNEIAEVKKIADELGSEFSCFFPEKATYFNNNDLNCDINIEAKKKIFDSLKKLFGYHYYMDNLRLLMNNKKHKCASCYSGYTSLVIDPYGNIKPCILKEDTFGNIKKQTLKDMLQSGYARKLRKNLKICSCWCQCEASASAIADPLDVLKWFLFFCSEKKGFIREAKKKLYKLS